jgi:hypothetical protein
MLSNRETSPYLLSLEEVKKKILDGDKVLKGNGEEVKLEDLQKEIEKEKNNLSNKNKGPRP